MNMNIETAPSNCKPPLSDEELQRVVKYLRSDTDTREMCMALFAQMRPYIRKRKRRPMVRYV